VRATLPPQIRLYIAEKAVHDLLFISMASIRLDNAEKVYPNGQVALHGLTLEIRDSELMVLVGPSGCGKTTTLRLIAGLETPTQGRIFLDNRDVTDWPPQKRDVAMVFQTYALYPHKSIRDNLGFGLRLRGVRRAEIAERVSKVAQTLGLDGVLGRKPGQLSGGQRQRVALGRAIVRQPKAFLLDEPLSNLDAQLRMQTRVELARLHRELKTTMLYVTHDQEEAMTLGERVAVICDGQLQQVAPPMELYQRPANAFVGEFIGTPAMIFFSGVLHNKASQVQFESLAFTLQLDGRDQLAAQSENVRLGVRPQDIEFVELAKADVAALVEVLQPLGSEKIVQLRLPKGGEISSVQSSEARVSAGDQVGLRFRRDRIHLFDAKNGRRLN
jgi:multiple sugar transport system ATP-binding protein